MNLPEYKHGCLFKLELNTFVMIVLVYRCYMLKKHQQWLLAIEEWDICSRKPPSTDLMPLRVRWLTLWALLFINTILPCQPQVSVFWSLSRDWSWSLNHCFVTLVIRVRLTCTFPHVWIINLSRHSLSVLKLNTGPITPTCVIFNYHMRAHMCKFWYVNDFYTTSCQQFGYA